MTSNVWLKGGRRPLNFHCGFKPLFKGSKSTDLNNSWFYEILILNSVHRNRDVLNKTGNMLVFNKTHFQLKVTESIRLKVVSSRKYKLRRFLFFFCSFLV